MRVRSRRLFALVDVVRRPFEAGPVVGIVGAVRGGLHDS